MTRRFGGLARGASRAPPPTGSSESEFPSQAGSHPSFRVSEFLRPGAFASEKQC